MQKLTMTIAEKVGGKVYVAATATNKEIDEYSKEYADNFDKLTSPAIVAQIDQRFGLGGAYQVKREWGVRNLLMMSAVNQLTNSADEVKLASAVDITGVSSVVAAYMKPICTNTTSFPVIHPLYKD